ncbi:MAG: putative cell surface protein [Actinomycetia bacterium]|nr:putative cell surface protein [Actinomycetes bacterium]
MFARRLRTLARALLLTSLVPLVGIIGASAATAATGTELVQNGSFEVGYPGNNICGNGWYGVGYGCPGTIPGWTVTGGGVDWQGTDNQPVPVDGTYAVDLIGGGAGTISQTLPTTAGRGYTATFAYAAHPGCIVNGTAVATARLGTTSTTISATVLQGWRTGSISFTATGSSTPISFTSVTDNGCGGIVLDTVSVIAAAPAIEFGPVLYESRQYTGGVVAAGNAISTFNGLRTNVAGYCRTTLPTLNGASNHVACPGGTSSSLAVHAEMHITINQATQWGFRFGPDAGFGGVLIIDGQMVDSTIGDGVGGGGFWDPNFTGGPTHYFDGSVLLAAGPHTVELYTYENCCDGPWGAQYLKTGTWVPITASEPSPDADGDGFADLIDNCVNVANASQADADADGIGDACDNQAPTMAAIPSILAEATGPAGAAVAYAVPVAQDAEDGAIPATCAPAPGSTFHLGATAVACAAIDSGGLRVDRAFTVTVRDTTAPVVSVPGDLVAEAVGPAGTPLPFAVAASDAVTGSIEPTCSTASGSTFALGTTVVTCAATDAAGNTGSSSFRVVVADTTSPAVVVPAALTVEAVGPDGAPVFLAASSDDAVSGPIEPVCSAPSGLFALGATVVTCSATDAAGNTGAASFTVTVVDTTAPALTAPAPFEVEADGPAGSAAGYVVTAQDAVSGALATACSTVSGSTFHLGTTAVTCTATDGAGNTGTATFTVTVVDTTVPVVTTPTGRTAEATSAAGATVGFVASSSDSVSGTLAASCAPASGSTFHLGTTLVTCSATDGAGNTGTSSFLVTVEDTTAPTVVVPSSRTVEATSAAGAAVPFASSATDAVSGPLASTCTPTSGSTLAIGSTTVTCVATDAAGNAGSATFTVTVRDSTKPVVAFSGNAGTYGVDDTVAISCAVTDAVTAGLTCAGASGPAYSFGIGSETITRSVADHAGNVGTASTTFTVKVVAGDLCTLVERLVPEKGIANSLCAKLRAGSYGAFRNELKAQSGKKVTAAAADLLTGLSLALG